jgi:hypothetical protein
MTAAARLESPPSRGIGVRSTDRVASAVRSLYVDRQDSRVASGGSVDGER